MTDVLPPRQNPILIGHDRPWAQLMEARAGGRLHHGLLITGPQGTGKSTFAYRLARLLLSGDEAACGNAAHPTFHRVASGAHGDLMVIEQEYDEKKGETAREIGVEEVRGVGEFFSRTAAEGFGRVVIVDAADALNINAANALLKVLEEPPSGGYLLMVCHSPGRLLPTIRSRCQQVKLAGLAREEVVQVLRGALPDESAFDLLALSELAGDSPGLALELHAREGRATYGELLELLAEGGGRLQNWEFSANASGKAMHAQWQVLTHVMLTLSSRAAKVAAGSQLTQEIVAGEGDFMHKLARRGPAFWAQWWQLCADQTGQAARLHLDYRQTLLSLLQALEPGRNAA